MSSVTFLVAITLIVVVAALVGMAIVRRLVPRERLSQHTEVAGYIYAVIGVIYGVILAQVVVAAWDEYRDALSVSEAEASAVLNLDRLARTWPDEDRERIRSSLIDYATAVVEVEWPAMATGDFSLAGDTTHVGALWSAYDDIALGPNASTANYAASLDQLQTVDDARRTRFALGERTLPQAMVVTLILGGIVTVAFSYLFRIDDRWLHAVMTASLAVLVALLLLLEYDLETPFDGVDAIAPTSMQLVLRTLAEIP